jgi:hypothetical protein
MAVGPTQNYDDATLGRWKPHPVLAVVVRVVLLAFPPLVALTFGAVAVHWVSADRLGMNPWVWLVGEITVATGLLLGMTQVTRRLLPVSTLLRLTLYFPDRAPSRFSVARRRYSPDRLNERLAAQPTGAQDAEHHHAAFLLDLVAAISAHDRSTRGHSERVQAYSALIGTELGLSRQDAAKLGWAALLHDVGKLRVPPEILDKAGLPTDEEWEVLTAHPGEGVAIARPLEAWLGPWLDVVGQHHERWDGAGYPQGLVGAAISRGARIVAVADAYDAITSARSYKKPLSPDVARAELARCSGRQFDPDVVRAFLAVGLGRLRLVAGPASALAALPGLPGPGSMRLPSLTSLLPDATTAVGTAGAVLASAALGAVAMVTGPAVATVDLAADTTGTLAFAGVDATAGLGTAPTLGAGTDTTADLPSESPAASPAPSPGPSRAPSETPLPDGSATPQVPSGARGSLVADPAPTAALAPAPGAPAPVPGAPAPTPADETACASAAAGDTSMAGANLAGCTLAGRTLTGDYSGADLSGADLSGATLTNLDLSGARLAGADLDAATISDTSFDDAQLTGASFTGATITRSSFLGSTANANTFRDATVCDSTFG